MVLILIPQIYVIFGVHAANICHAKDFLPRLLFAIYDLGCMEVLELSSRVIGEAGTRPPCLPCSQIKSTLKGIKSTTVRLTEIY
jgi:hypothetical protein